jgi:hypothetical protein
MFVLQRIAGAFFREQVFHGLAQSADSLACGRAMDSVRARGAAFEAGKWRP